MGSAKHDSHHILESKQKATRQARSSSLTICGHKQGRYYVTHWFENLQHEPMGYVETKILPLGGQKKGNLQHEGAYTWPHIVAWQKICMVRECCLALSCLVLSCLAFNMNKTKPSDPLPCLVLPSLLLSCLALSCLALSCLLSCLALPCLAFSCFVLSCLVFCLALPCLALSCLVLPCRVLLSKKGLMNGKGMWNNTTNSTHCMLTSKEGSEIEKPSRYDELPICQERCRSVQLTKWYTVVRRPHPRLIRVSVGARYDHDEQYASLIALPHVPSLHHIKEGKEHTHTKSYLVHAESIAKRWVYNN